MACGVLDGILGQERTLGKTKKSRMWTLVNNNVSIVTNVPPKYTMFIIGEMVYGIICTNSETFQ